MKAVRIHSFGGPDMLALEDVPKPRPGAHEVLIRVEAAGVNPVDYKIRSGDFKPVGLQLPLTLGRDVSGVVEEVGVMWSANTSVRKFSLCSIARRVLTPNT